MQQLLAECLLLFSKNNELIGNYDSLPANTYCNACTRTKLCLLLSGNEHRYLIFEDTHRKCKFYLSLWFYY